MQAPSPELFDQAVTIRRKSEANSRGVGVATYADSPALAFVQPQTGQREPGQGIADSVGLHKVYFQADPDVAADDLVVWRGRTLAVLARATDSCGKGVLHLVVCREVS